MLVLYLDSISKKNLLRDSCVAIQSTLIASRSYDKLCKTLVSRDSPVSIMIMSNKSLSVLNTSEYNEIIDDVLNSIPECETIFNGSDFEDLAFFLSETVGEEYLVVESVQHLQSESSKIDETTVTQHTEVISESAVILSAHNLMPVVNQPVISSVQFFRPDNNKNNN